MKHQGLHEDFDNIRSTQSLAVCNVINEAQKYISHLEDKENALESILQYLDSIDKNDKTETKTEILEAIFKIMNV